MKTLPDSPNLDHLRQQAKDLLPQIRAVRGGATLSDAQTALAEQYGFRTWPDLKAEVERRSAAIPMSVGEDLAEAVAEAFDLGTPVGPLVPHERQWAGQAWVLATDRGRWLARSLFDWFDERGIDAEVLLAESAAAAGITTPRPVRTRSGAVVECLHGSRWRVFELLALGPEPALPADPRYAAAVGRIVAKVHGFGIAAPGPVQRWLTRVVTESQWWGLHRAADSAGMPWADRFATVIPTLVDVGGVVEVVDPEAALVLAAGNYGPSAVRVGSAGELVVMTWEHAGTVPRRWDLGGAITSWSAGVPGGINRGAVTALVAGYAELADLPEPLDLGMFSAAVCAHLNWIGSRVDLVFDDGIDADRREVAARAIPGLLADPPSRQRLEAILDALR